LWNEYCGSNTKATLNRWLFVCSFLGSFFASLPAFVQVGWAFVGVTPMLALLVIVNYWRDAMHFALSIN